MRCTEARRRISRALDDELDPREATALAEHLEGCAECARFKADQARINAALAAMAVPEATEGQALRMATHVRAGVEATSEPVRVSWYFRAAALAAMLLLTAGVVFLSIRLKEARTQIARLSAGLPAVESNGHAELTVMGGVPIPRPAALEQGVDQQVQAFLSVQKYLGGALRWMASDGDQVEVGMSGAAGVTPVAAHDVMVVSFQYLEHLRDGKTALLSSPQFVLLPGEEASVRLAARDAAAKEAFRYRVSARRSDGHIRAEVSFSPEGTEAQGPAEIASRITAEVQVKEGVPVLLGASGDPASRRELYMLVVTRLQGSAAPSGAGGAL